LSPGSIVFVHGTGVRLRRFLATYETATSTAAACGMKQTFIPCTWGDPIGIEFEGKSLPDPPTAEQIAKQEDEFAHWNWLLDDPLFELSTLTIRDRSSEDKAPTRPDEQPAWEKLWNEVEAYQPSEELRLLLERGGLFDLWVSAWSATVLQSDIPREAFEASVHELPEACRALARSIVAQLHTVATSQDRPGPSAMLRTKLVDRMLTDWDQQVLGLSDFFFNLVKRAGTRFVRTRRNAFNEAAAFPIGDVLLYQAHGKAIREFIRGKIETARPPVTVVAHSLGGIACVDLLASAEPPAVDHLITLGSQSPFLYEIGALSCLKPGAGLPKDFPPWLNIFDRNDFLSFFAGRLFPEVKDHEVLSGQPFPDSHSAYFGNEAVWSAIRTFIAASAK
jgi:hypothetical protein